MIFKINNTVIWALAMLIFTDQFIKLYRPLTQVINRRYMEKIDLDSERTKGYVEIVSNILGCIQGFIFTGIFLLGTVNGCFLLGGFICLCGITLFFIEKAYNRKLKITE